MAIKLTKITAEVIGTARLVKYGEQNVIAGFRLAVDTLAYGTRSGALGLYNSPEEYLREVLKEMEDSYRAMDD